MTRVAVVSGPALPLGEVDVDERLVRGDHEQLVGEAVGGEREGDARPPEPRDADVDLDLVVEDGRREVLDVVRPHHEVAAAARCRSPSERRYSTRARSK